MQALPRRNIIVVMVAVTVYALIFALLAWLIAPFPIGADEVSSKTLSVMIGAGVLLSMFSMSAAWRWQGRMQASLADAASPFKIWGITIVFGFAPFIAPQIYGLLLFFLGMHFLAFLCFAAVSIGAVLVWGIPKLKSP